jgi:hypothetical protein
VAKLSRRWGTGHDEDGIMVWAEVELPQMTTVAVPAAAVESG